ncbi:hypothetical protein ACPUVO_05530 [Pseudocolwellia sp. HL-MZ19]|uniref:hypothetical protein n=1 Tax=unclassified Pseudocolwellia TaxID=2848178 RepID=UPI003CF134ED
MPNKNKFLLLLLAIVLAIFSILILYSDAVESVFNRLNDPVNIIAEHNPQQAQKQNESKTVNSSNQQQLSELFAHSTSATCFAPLLSATTTETKAILNNDNSEHHQTTKKYYVLTTNLDDQSGVFTNELNQKLFFVFQHIENEFNINFSHKLDLSIAYQGSRTDYEDYVMEQGRSPEGTIGVYLYPEHASVIEFIDHKQAITTSIHETIHAFNRSYWGELLRFFNEGMAEYFEKVAISGEFKAFDFSGLQDQKYPMEIENLLFSETDWHGDNNHKLYQNSNALFHFLMSNEKGRSLIWEIMQLEKEESCSVLPESTILEVLFEMYPNHQQEFDYWFEDGLALFLKNKKQS